MSVESRKLAGLIINSSSTGSFDSRKARRRPLAASALWIAILCVVCSGCNDDVIAPAGPTVNNDLFSSVTLAASSGVFYSPASAVPDASGQFIYFVADGPNGHGVFKVAATGGTASEVAVGAPFSAPVDIAMSTDNQTLYIADSTAGGTGRIFSLSIAGGSPIVVPGTEGTAPVALDVIQMSGQDRIYFCGTNAADMQKAVFEISTSGGTLIVRYKGGALVSPAGIVSTMNGTLFIADRSGATHKLSGATLTQVANGTTMGAPPGIALTPDDKTVVVSSRNPTDGTAQVQIIDLQSGRKSIFNKVIGSNSNPGGLHGARNASGQIGAYAWANSDRNGKVYLVEP